MTTLLAPIDLSAAVQAGPRVFRKQVLEKRTIRYPMPGGERREVAFDDAYLRDLAASYNAGAYDLVPFQLATPANEHNEDPRNYGGRVIGLEVTDTGLDAILELTEDTASLVERTGGRLGVSARIKEALEHVDGRRFKRAIRHVLGTLDPRMTGMGPWQAVDLSTDDGDVVLDLSRAAYQGDTMTRPTLDLSNLDPEAAEQLESFAAANGLEVDVVLPEGVAGDEPDLDDDEQDDEHDDDELDGTDEDTTDDEGDEGDDEVEPLSDAELDALLDAEVAAMAGADLSADVDDDETLDLAAGIIAGASDEVQTARRETAEARYELARERYGAGGVPPYVLELCRPVLELGEDTTELNLSSPATGDPIDVRGIVTGLLDAMSGTVDLSTETGHGHTSEDGEQDDAARAWTDYLENN